MLLTRLIVSRLSVEISLPFRFGTDALSGYTILTHFCKIAETWFAYIAIVTRWESVMNIRNVFANRVVLLPMLSVVASMALTSCTTNDDSRVVALEKDVAQLKVTVAKLEAENKAAAPAQAPAQLPIASSTVQTVAATVNGASYGDISGRFGEQEIVNLAKLSVLEPAANFEPTKPVSRREFARWLFKATNALKPESKIRPAEGATSAFTDLTTNDADFAFIQGLADAGIAVGYEDKTFRPDQAITREEMLSIKGYLDAVITGRNPYGDGSFLGGAPYGDKTKVAKRLQPGMDWAYWFGDIRAVLGTAKVLKPQQPATRAEAVVCMSVVGEKR